MLIEYRNGRRKEVKDAAARYLIKIGTAKAVVDYENRSMENKPRIQKVVTPEKQEDGLDLLDKASLHALAKERGLKLHHMLGEEKVRAALRGESYE